MKKIYPGILILVVGNSGSGKDSIIKRVVESYSEDSPKIHSVKRYITRPPSETENNIAISGEEFKKLDRQHKFVLKWKIYGLYYGVPVEIEEWLEKGDIVLVNVSRTIVNKTRKLYENVKVVFINVPFEISVQRLKQRGRENDKRLHERIKRARLNQTFSNADFVIDNSENLDTAVNQFLHYLKRLLNSSY